MFILFNNPSKAPSTYGPALYKTHWNTDRRSYKAKVFGMRQNSHVAIISGQSNIALDTHVVTESIGLWITGNSVRSYLKLD